MQCPACEHEGDADEFHIDEEADALGFVRCPVCGVTDDWDEFMGGEE